MIIDRLENLKNYAALHPLFRQVADYLSTHELTKLEVGKINLQGGDLVLNVQQTKPKTQEEARLETHRLFIDIQIPVSGTEVIGYTPARDCRPADALYDEEKDIAFFEGKAQSYLEVRPGMFTIFFPGDGHAPGITPTGVKKIVVKVRV